MGDALDSLRREADVVLSGRHFHVEQVRSAGLVLVTRGTTPFESLTAAEESFANVAKAYPYMREHWRLLTDLRLAPMRTDAAFERIIRRVHPEMVRGFSNHAIVVKTAVGTLQVSRQTQENETFTLVTQSAAEALRFLGIPGVITEPPEQDQDESPDV